MAPVTTAEVTRTILPTPAVFIRPVSLVRFALILGVGRPGTRGYRPDSGHPLVSACAAKAGSVPDLYGIGRPLCGWFWSAGSPYWRHPPYDVGEGGLRPGGCSRAPRALVGRPVEVLVNDAGVGGRG